jgi:hypothetical protein
LLFVHEYKLFLKSYIIIVIILQRSFLCL